MLHRPIETAKMYSDGHGHPTVAKTMNADPRYKEKNQKYFVGEKPSSPRKGTGSWAPSSVRAILHNERYRGVIPFGRHSKVYKGGTKKRVKQEDYQLIDAPHFQIVDDVLWSKVQRRLESVAKTYI